MTVILFHLATWRSEQWWQSDHLIATIAYVQPGDAVLTTRFRSGVISTV